MFSIYEGKIVDGVVRSISYYHDQFIVDIGSIYTCTVDSILFHGDKFPSVGDTIKLVVLKVDDKRGMVELKPYRPEEQYKPKEKPKNESEIEKRIIDKISTELSQMKPALITEIALSVYTRVEKQYAEKIKTLEDRVAYLERIIENSKH